MCCLVEFHLPAPMLVCSLSCVFSAASPSDFQRLGDSMHQRRCMGIFLFCLGFVVPFENSSKMILVLSKHLAFIYLDICQLPLCSKLRFRSHYLCTRLCQLLFWSVTLIAVRELPLNTLSFCHKAEPVVTPVSYVFHTTHCGF